MAHNNNLQIKKKHIGYKLVINENAIPGQYEMVINYLIKRLNISKMEEINDFDTYYHLFIYKGEKMVLTYSVDFGISLSLDDGGVNEDHQIKILTEFAEILSGVDL
jgi:hypothetical protein